MRRAVFAMFTVLCLAAAAFAASSLGPWAPVTDPPGIDATGGPDAYGYTWIDSNEPGGPVYNWKDITTTGTLVGDLGDDNYVGPFNIGFPFHYYWYDVTTYYIGSNGYLKFPPPYNMAQPFPATIPLAAAPNDYIAFYVADWYPGVPAGSGQCYRWNNADSLVVSYINLHPWVGPGVTDGAHTFQVILSRLDSSITFQFGAQSGTVSNNDLLTGIENNNGQVGLVHSATTYPPSNYTVYFNSPASTGYVVHDAAAMAAANDLSQGFFVLNNTAVSPYGKVKNVGNQNEAGFPVSCTIQQLGGGTVYNQSVTSNALTPGQEQAITFTPNWTPTAATEYFFNVTTNLTGDMNPNNNLKRTECRVMTLPGTMMFDDGTMNQSWSWQGGNGGLGMRFVPPTYPVDLDCVRFYMAAAGTSPFQAQVLDDDGPSGEPGTVLFQQNISPTGAGWFGAVTNLSITSGAFYVAYQMVDSNTAALGYDSTNGMGSRQALEFTGVWSAFRNAETSDFMIRAKVSQPGVIPNVTVALIPYGTPIIIPASGGSFSYNIATTNNEPTTQTYQGWCMLTLPNQTQYGPVLGPVTVTLPTGASINRDRTQVIPNYAPAGNYVFNGYVGVYPGDPWDTDNFPFTKSATGDGGIWYNEYANYGEPFDMEAPAVQPEAFSLNGNHPNPFNPATTINFSLPEASQVTLTVYDVQGQVVAQLVNGWRNAGSHSAAFDGTNLASGIYVYRLTAGSFNATGKMVLMK